MTDIEVAYQQVGLLIDEIRALGSTSKAKADFVAALTSAEELADAMESIDRWLCEGKPLPHAWAHRARRADSP